MNSYQETAAILKIFLQEQRVLAGSARKHDDRKTSPVALCSEKDDSSHCKTANGGGRAMEMEEEIGERFRCSAPDEKRSSLAQAKRLMTSMKTLKQTT